MYNYRAAQADLWRGRVDSQENADAFRLHQMVEIIDLNKPAELKNHQKKAINFAIAGFESDLGVRLNKGQAGASEAPDVIRTKLASLPYKLHDATIIDVGNIYADDDLTKAQKSLGEVVKDLMNQDYLPIILGGGHETALAVYYGHQFKGSDNLGIINIDAHFDNRPYQETGPSSGTMFRQIKDMTAEKGQAYQYFILGIQDHGNTQDLFHYADATGTKYFSTQEIISDKSDRIYQALDTWLNTIDQVMLTIDMDVFNAALAPGVSAVQPFGLFPEHIMPYLNYMIESGKVASIDIVEVSPPNDYDNNQTAQLAGVILYYLMAEWAKVEAAKN